MRTTLLVVVVSLSTLAFAQSTAPVISTRMTGTYADSTLFLNGSAAHIFVTQDTSGQTLLIYNYGAFRNPDGSFTFMFGAGYIPSDSVTLNNANVAHLDVDTSQVAGFRATSCTFFLGQPGTCTSGPFGIIQIDWQKNGITTNRTVNENWQTFPGARLHTQLSNDLNSASAAGTFLGNKVSSDLGDIGTTTNSLFEVFAN